MAKKQQKRKSPRVLFFDIETAPLLGYAWSLWQQDIGLNQLVMDWSILSFSAKWQGSKEVIYADMRGRRNVHNDKHLLKKLWKLLDEADIVVTQNGKAFDEKKVNARFIQNDMNPPSTFRHIDTFQLAKKYFGFTSNKLEYLSKILGKKYKKQSHNEFPGFSLWSECLKGNLKAWRCMEKYNKYDTLALEEVYNKMAPWGTGIDFRVFDSQKGIVCPSCLSKSYRSDGFAYTNTGKFQRYKCSSCGHRFQSKGAKKNLLSKEKRERLKT